MNHEKVFYKALLRFREDQLEHYEGPLEYSTSDYHHIARRVSVSRNRHPRSFSGQAQNRSWRGSQFSIATDRSYCRASYKESKSTRTVSSYDPYRSSRTPIVNPRVEYANVVVHRASDDSNSDNESAHSRDKYANGFTSEKKNAPEQKSAVPSSSLKDVHWNGSRMNSARSLQTRSSVASFPRRARRSSTTRSLSYKRNVSFRQTSNRSTGECVRRKRVPQADSQYSLPNANRRNAQIRVGGDNALSSDAFSSPNLPTPPQTVRTRRPPGRTTKPDAPKQRISCQIWKDDARKMSTELGKICEEAFNRSSISSSAATEDTADFRSSESTPPTSASTPGDVGKSSDLGSFFPLVKPQAGSYNTYTAKELTETRRRLIEHSTYGTPEALPEYLSEVIAHLDRLIGRESIMDAGKRNAEISQSAAASSLEAGFLPAISEVNAGNEEDSGSTRPDYKDKKKTIRVVPHESIVSIEPSHTKCSNRVSSSSMAPPNSIGYHRPSTNLIPEEDHNISRSRRSSRYYGNLEPIEEVPKSPTKRNENRNSADVKKWGWFKNKSQELIDARPPTPPSKDYLSKPVSSSAPRRENIPIQKQSLPDDKKEDQENGYISNKKRGFFSIFNRKKASRPVHELCRSGTIRSRTTLINRSKKWLIVITLRK